MMKITRCPNMVVAGTELTLPQAQMERDALVTSLEKH